MFAICKEDCGERDCGTNLLWVQPKVELQLRMAEKLQLRMAEKLQLRMRKASAENG